MSDVKFEVVTTKQGRLGWHLRDSDSGQILEVRTGKIMLPPTTNAESRRVRNATTHGLRAIAKYPFRKN